MAMGDVKGIMLTHTARVDAGLLMSFRITGGGNVEIGVAFSDVCNQVARVRKVAGERGAGDFVAAQSQYVQNAFAF